LAGDPRSTIPGTGGAFDLMSAKGELFISIDIEAAGPIPGEYSMLSLGACDALHPEQTFLCTLKPINDQADPKALEVSGFTLEELRKTGLDPKAAMERFEKWIQGLATHEESVVFVGFNAPFDWSFVNYYFHRFLGRNPFGFSALDIKALYMGATGCAWNETKSSVMAKRLHPTLEGDHNALHDALYQAELFRLVRDISGK
jgi:DNA polymerase III epsilon subunit-like protein